MNTTPIQHSTNLKGNRPVNREVQDTGLDSPPLSQPLPLPIRYQLYPAVNLLLIISVVGPEHQQLVFVQVVPQIPSLLLVLPDSGTDHYQTSHHQMHLLRQCSCQQRDEPCRLDLDPHHLKNRWSGLTIRTSHRHLAGVGKPLERQPMDERCYAPLRRKSPSPSPSLHEHPQALLVPAPLEGINR